MADATLQRILSRSQGARFVRADLHIHSHPASDDVADAGMVPARIAERATSDGISIIAITDHNTDTGLAAAVAVARPDLLVVPGVEIATGDGHLLGLFDPINVAEVGRLLAQLEVRNVRPGELATTRSMVDCIDAIERADGISIAAHVDTPAGLEAMVPGYGPAKRAVLLSPRLGGVELHNAANIAWYTAADPQAARYAIVSERRTRDETRWRPDLPRVRGSDAHAVGEIGRGPAGTARITRVKLDALTFSGLRTAFKDPSARLRIEEDVRENYAELVGLTCEGGFLDGLDFRFSRNLTCFIGGRGTGKSTVLEVVRWTLGVGRPDFEAQLERAPRRSVLYFQLESGATFRVERERGGEPHVQADSGADVPLRFEIETYGQGELAEIARSTSGDKAGDLLAFLDQFVEGARTSREEVALTKDQLAASDQQLYQAERKTASYAEVTKQLDDVDAKLKAAATGNLREVVSARERLGAARRFRDKVKSRADAAAGSVRTAVGRLRREDMAEPQLGDLPSEVDRALETFNEAVVGAITRATSDVQSASSALTEQLGVWGRADLELTQRVDVLAAQLEAQGLQPNLNHLRVLLERQDKLRRAKQEMDTVKAGQAADETVRRDLMGRIAGTRQRMSALRDKYAEEVTRAISEVLPGGRVSLGYRREGLPLEYFAMLERVATGSYLHDETLRRLARRCPPDQLRALILADRRTDIAAFQLGDGQTLGEEAAGALIAQFQRNPLALHELEHVGRDDLPVLQFLTSDGTARGFHQLSQGQRHTILLAVAFASGRRCPVLIDQPEDELDNAFVFEHVVRQLRSVKERRQVILVSHNANVVVLGDSELIYVMGRTEADRARVIESGSVDHAGVKPRVVLTLEGGELAFRRRSEMYA